MCCSTILLVVPHVPPSEINGKCPRCCGRFNAKSIIIGYLDGRTNIPSKPLTPTPRSLWTDPALVLSLKCN